MVLKTPPEWQPDHPDYPLHLVRQQLGAMIYGATATLHMIGVENPRAVVAKALWEVAMEHDAERAITNRRREPSDI